MDSLKEQLKEMEWRLYMLYDPISEDDEKGKSVITYAGVDQETKKWGRLKTWGGKLVEENYTWKAVVNAMVKGYEEILNDRT